MGGKGKESPVPASRTAETQDGSRSAPVRSEDEEEAAESHITNTECDPSLVVRWASTSCVQEGWWNTREVVDVPGPAVNQVGGEYCVQSRRQGTGQPCPCHQPGAHSLMHDGPMAQWGTGNQAVAIGHEEVEEALVPAQELGGGQLGHAAVEGEGYAASASTLLSSIWILMAGNSI